MAWFETIEWLLISGVVVGNGLLAWQLARTWRSRILLFAIYSVGVLMLLGLLIIVTAAATQLLNLDVASITQRWIMRGILIFWLLALAGAALRVRRFDG